MRRYLVTTQHEACLCVSLAVCCLCNSSLDLVCLQWTDHINTRFSFLLFESEEVFMIDFPRDWERVHQLFRWLQHAFAELLAGSLCQCRLSGE